MKREQLVRVITRVLKGNFPLAEGIADKIIETEKRLKEQNLKERLAKRAAKAAAMTEEEKAEHMRQLEYRRATRQGRKV